MLLLDFRLEPPMLSTSLSIAAQYNHVKFAEFLIDEGATVGGCCEAGLVLPFIVELKPIRGFIDSNNLIDKHACKIMVVSS